MARISASRTATVCAQVAVPRPGADVLTGAHGPGVEHRPPAAIQASRTAFHDTRVASSGHS